MRLLSSGAEKTGSRHTQENHRAKPENLEEMEEFSTFNAVGGMGVAAFGAVALAAVGAVGAFQMASAMAAQAGHTLQKDKSSVKETATTSTATTQGE
ncbi:hypothetical protein HOP50_01g00840 [Chloropicon primus]|uniref:Uncharacterized protein n=1 Tax=Chloropicon primus TaxID=1764295 RepID=A0A5B8MD85_9CHLO|nr:hypothetical protein A3770_01p00930 [Chloropicon primus]UPQ96793.1 hypothetical protein HOP50_01g00840 [Chloropicon primus]|eukprot:QDZ17575.1 hypothetical protein A3770_01p00930 [Chloropicon primus]